MIPRTLRAANIDIEGYFLGLDTEGQFFASATTSNYPFSFVDSKYTVCSSNTIFLKTNLNNIVVANNDIVSTSILVADDEGELSHRIGKFQGIMPDGELGHKIAILPGFDGQVLAFGLRENVTEQDCVYGAFSTFLRTVVLAETKEEDPAQLINVNVIDVDVIRNFMQTITKDKEKDRIFAEFKTKLISSQIATYPNMTSSEEFYKGLAVILA